MSIGHVMVLLACQQRTDQDAILEHGAWDAPTTNIAVRLLAKTTDLTVLTVRAMYLKEAQLGPSHVAEALLPQTTSGSSLLGSRHIGAGRFY
jgi:hypothetical protein